MQFRVRPSSKKSNNNEQSLVEYSHKPFTDSGIPKAVNNRIEAVESMLSSFQELYRRQREQSSVSYIEMQRRLDKLQYKAYTAEQDLKQLGEIRQIKPIRESYQNNTGYQTSKNQVMLLKQVILQDKQSHKENIKYQNALIEQLSMKQLKTEQELRDMISKQRLEYDHRLMGQGEEIRQIESLKQRKMQQQYEMMKGVISNAEKKIYEQLQRKIRNQTVVKDFVEQKIADLKEQLSNEHKQTMNIEAKFIRETKQSLQHLFGLISTVKKQLSDELGETQKLAVNNIKRLSMSVDIAREKTNDELKHITAANKEINNQLVDVRNFLNSKLEQNRQIMSEFQEQQIQRYTKTDYSRPSSNAQGHSVDGQKFSLFQKEMHQWRSLTQQKNLNVFKEISSTLKTMKSEWRKENDEMVSQIAALNQSLKGIRKSGPAELKKSVQAIITIFNNQFDVLADELETLTNMIALSKKQNEKLIKQQLSKVQLEMTEQTKTLISQRSKQTTIQMQKMIARSQETMKGQIQSQAKFMADALAIKIQKTESEMNKLQSMVKKNNVLTTTQLEDYSLKIKNFNDSYKQYLQEQRKEDLKKRVQLEDSMRKNASNLMDICYKKSQYLVDGLKNNIQIMQMKQKVEAQQSLDLAKDQLKKQLQGARAQFQKDLAANQQKLTKQRQSSQQILHEAMQQSINNTKRSLTNEIGNNKIQLQEKINEIKVKQIQKDATAEAKFQQLKTSVTQIIQEQKRLNQQSLNKSRQQVEEKLAQRQKASQDKQLQMDKQIVEMKSYLTQMIRDQKRLNQQNIIKTRKQLQQKIVALQKSQSMKQLQNKQKQSTNKQQSEAKNKSLNDKVQGLEKRLNQIKTEADSHNAKVSSDDKIKEGQINTKIAKLQLDLQNNKKEGIEKYKKIDQINQKIAEITKSNEKDQGESKKVGQQNVKQIRQEFQKSIKDLQIRLSQMKAKDSGNEHEQSISNMKKSLNKLQAMVFSQQAKNKAMFDRLTEDVTKVSEDLTLLASEMR